MGEECDKGSFRFSTGPLNFSKSCSSNFFLNFSRRSEDVIERYEGNFRRLRRHGISRRSGIPLVLREEAVGYTKESTIRLLVGIVVAGVRPIQLLLLSGLFSRIRSLVMLNTLVPNLWWNQQA